MLWPFASFLPAYYATLDLKFQVGWRRRIAMKFGDGESQGTSKIFQTFGGEEHICFEIRWNICIALKIWNPANINI